MKTFTKFWVTFTVDVEHSGTGDLSKNWQPFRDAHMLVPAEATNVHIETLRTFTRQDESDKKAKEAMTNALGIAVETPAVSDTEQPKAPLTDIPF